MKIIPGKTLSLILGIVSLAAAPAARSEVVLNTDTFDSIGAEWTPDRHPSAIFQSSPNPHSDVNNSSANALQIGVAAADYQANHFFDYQGYRKDISLSAGSALNYVQTQLYLDPAWQTTSRIRTGLWLGSATDPTWVAIFGFSNLNGNNPTLEYFDNNLPGGGDWVSLGTTIDWGTWMTFNLTFTSADIDFYANGALVAEISNGGNLEFGSLAIENENGVTGDPQGVTYSAYYDNLVAPVPEPSTCILGGLGVFLLVLEQRRRRSAVKIS